MKLNRRGVSLLELTFAMGLGLAVLAVGYRTYFGVIRADEVQARRESMTITVQNLMGRIKDDIRSAGSVSASGNSLVLNGGGRQIRYQSLADGSTVERIVGHGKARFNNVSAEFAGDGCGAKVTLRSGANIHRRVIRVEINSYVTPRN